MAVVGKLLKATNVAVSSALSRLVAGISAECVEVLDVLVVVDPIGRDDVLLQAVRRNAEAMHATIAIERRARIVQVSHWSSDGARHCLQTPCGC